MYPKYEIGTRIKDKDGFEGIITKITEYKGSRWYEVRFNANAARYDFDLTIAEWSS